VNGLFNLGIGALGTILIWAVVIGVLYIFAAAVLYLAGRVLPLRRHKRHKQE